VGPSDDLAGAADPAGAGPETPVEEQARVSERMRARVERTRARFEKTVHKVEQTETFSPAFATGRASIRSDRAVAGSLLGGAMGFRLFLWLVPAVLVLVAVFGLVASAADTDPSDLAGQFGLSVYIAQSISENSTTSSVVALGVGLIGLWFGGIGGYKALWTIHQLAWRMEVTPTKQAWKGGLWFTGTLLGTLVTAGFVNKLRADDPGLGLALTLLFMTVYGGVWFLVSARLPHPDVPSRAFVPGALMFGLGMEVLHLVTVLYFANRVAHASEVYGPLGVAIGLLAWLYLMGRLSVASPVLNATLHERRQERELAGRPDVGGGIT
jgi:uncharacterized BrkB/YihY/UPF0761 family membrane protein